jgi:hypothetical protein
MDPGSRIRTRNTAFLIPGQEPAIPDNVGMFVALPEQLHLPVRYREAGGQHPLHSHVAVVKFTLNISVLGIRIWRISMFLGLQDPDPSVRSTDPDPFLFLK